MDKETKSRNAEQTREAILQAALTEFSRENVAGARTDEIARSAGVNKALLYYYFKDKDSLYEAVLDHAFSSIYPRLEAILDSDLTFQEKILSYCGTHFDALAQNPQFCRVIHHELTRFGHHSEFPFKKLTSQHHVQLSMKLQQVLHAGINAGEFRPVDTMNFAVSMVATNVFYFVSAPILRAITGLDPFTPEKLEARRAAVLDLISHALFAREAEANVTLAPEENTIYERT